MENRDEYRPMCCGQPAKWVEISVNLKYHYCEKCKNEVGGKATSAPYADAIEAQHTFQRRKGIDLTAMNQAYKAIASGALPMGAPQGLAGATSPPPINQPPTGGFPPANYKFSVGQKVYVNHPNIVGTDLPGTVQSQIAGNYYHVDFDHRHGIFQTLVLAESDLSSTPKYNPTQQVGFKVGDRVVVVSTRVISHGDTGIITDMNHIPMPVGNIRVEYGSGGGCWDTFEANELKLLP